MTAFTRHPASGARGPGALLRRATRCAVAGIVAATLALLPAGSPLIPAARGADRLEMQLVELPADLTSGPLDAVITGGPGYIAVGVGGARVGGPVILTSPDGTAWERVTLSGTAALGSILDVTAFTGGYAAVGGHRGTALVWLSEDGLDWVRVEVEGTSAPVLLSSVTAWKDGLFAIGCASDQPCITDSGWSSPDGRTWTFEGPLGASRAIYQSVGSGFGRLFAAGVTGVYGEGIVAMSGNGRRWTEHALDVTSTLDSVEVLEKGVAVVGTRYGAEADPDPDSTGGWGVPSGLIIYTPDRGRTWFELPASAPSGSSFSGLSAGTETIAYGASSTGGPEAWVTRMGLDWRPIAEADPAPPESGSISDMVPAIDGLEAVAVGRLGPGYADDPPAIWVVQPQG